MRALLESLLDEPGLTPRHPGTTPVDGLRLPDATTRNTVGGLR